MPVRFLILATLLLPSRALATSDFPWFGSEATPPTQIKNLNQKLATANIGYANTMHKCQTLTCPARTILAKAAAAEALYHN